MATIDTITDETGSQRDRILEISLKLMSEHGVHAMSMRRLADACGLNVATIYHYFPSKADLLTQVIAHQSYEERLSFETPPVDAEAPLRARLEQLLSWLWAQMSQHDDMWRLLLGESLRGDQQAMTSAASLSATFEATLNRWLSELVPDLPGDRATSARVLRGLIYGFFIENLPLAAPDRQRFLDKRAAEIATVLAPA